LAKKKPTKKGKEKTEKSSVKPQKDEVPLKEAAKFFKKHNNYFEPQSDLEPDSGQEEKLEEDDSEESEDMYE